MLGFPKTLGPYCHAISTSVDIVSYSGPSGILGSGGKQKNTLAGARRVRIVAFSINSHMQTQ